MRDTKGEKTNGSRYLAQEHYTLYLNPFTSGKTNSTLVAFYTLKDKGES
jgi:hypothetical protein